MKDNMLIFASLCLLLCWMQPAGSKKISFTFPLPVAEAAFKLDMVQDAVDDMYFGCNETMMKMMMMNDKNSYFKKENAGIFARAWKRAENCVNRKLQFNDDALTKFHKQAICVYTSNFEKFYVTFNAKVQTNRAKYRDSFPFHFLHFWLTSAVKILNKNKKCQTTYRRSKSKFTGNVDDIIRFGSFTSSSYDTTLTQFGNQTCFKIKTCSGAFLKQYPYLDDKEQEVLIPPYEMFKITKINESINDCEVIFSLESVGVHSNLNCKVAYK